MEGTIQPVASLPSADEQSAEKGGNNNTHSTSDNSLDKVAGKPKVVAGAEKVSIAGNNSKEAPPSPRPPVEINLQTLLKAGAHFGHQTSRWHPLMEPYIHSSRNGIHIINLPKTIQCWQRTRKAIVECVANGGNVLYVGTKKQAQEVIVEEAKRCGAFYVHKRWLGGMITNFQTIRKSIERMKKIEKLLEDEEQRVNYTKKELLLMSKDLAKLDFSLGGIRNMYGAPSMFFIIDTKREEIAVKEARRLDIPIVALLDTNCNPTGLDYLIPSNDDATRAIRLFCSAVADAILEGKREYLQRQSLVKSQKQSEEPQKSESKTAAKGKSSVGDSRGSKKKEAKAEDVAKEEEVPSEVADSPVADIETVSVVNDVK